MTALFELPQSEPPRKAVGFKLFSHWQWSEIAPRIDADVLDALAKIRPFDSTLAWDLEMRDAFGPRGEKPRQEWLVVKGMHEGLLDLGARQGRKFKTLRVFVHDPSARLFDWLNWTETRTEVATTFTILRDRLLGRSTEFPPELRPLRDDSCFSNYACNGSCNREVFWQAPQEHHDENLDVWFSLSSPHKLHERGAVGTEKLKELKRRAQERGLGRV